MPNEREMQDKQIHNIEHTSEKSYEHLLTTRVMGKLDVFAHDFNHRRTNRCMSVRWMAACHMYQDLGDQKLYIKTLNSYKNQPRE